MQLNNGNIQAGVATGQPNGSIIGGIYIFGGAPLELDLNTSWMRTKISWGNRYEGGWNLNALVATAVGCVFSTILPNFTSLLPAWWGTYGWFFGVLIGVLIVWPRGLLGEAHGRRV